MERQDALHLGLGDGPQAADDHGQPGDPEQHVGRSVGVGEQRAQDRHTVADPPAELAGQALAEDAGALVGQEGLGRALHQHDLRAGLQELLRVDRELREGRLVSILQPYIDPSPLEMFALYPTRAFMPAALKLFLQALSESCVQGGRISAGTR